MELFRPASYVPDKWMLSTSNRLVARDQVTLKKDTPWSDDSGIFRFLDLPLEIREIVYAFVRCHRCEYQDGTQTNMSVLVTTSLDPTTFRLTKFAYQVLSICRQIRSEAFDLVVPTRLQWDAFVVSQTSDCSFLQPLAPYMSKVEKLSIRQDLKYFKSEFLLHIIKYFPSLRRVEVLDTGHMPVYLGHKANSQHKIGHDFEAGLLISSAVAERYPGVRVCYRYLYTLLKMPAYTWVGLQEYSIDLINSKMFSKSYSHHPMMGQVAVPEGRHLLDWINLDCNDLSLAGPEAWSPCS